MTTKLLRFLGQLGDSVPELKMEEWKAIFRFLDYFAVIDQQDAKISSEMDWKKITEVLMLLKKIKD